MTVAWIPTMTNKLMQAYRQTPWRIQKQWIGLFALALVLVAAVALIYLNISAQAADTGLEIQQLQEKANELERQIISDRSEIAFLTSSEKMEERASALGYQKVQPGQTLFLSIPGYNPRTIPSLAPAPGPDIVQPSLITEEYTQSLWDIFIQKLLNSGTEQAKVLP
jgi:cell division protein FtsB